MIDEELSIIKDNIAEYGQTNITQEEYNMIYNNAIDDYRTEICKAFVQEERNGNYRFYAVEIKQLIADLGEQLKVGGDSE